ncbi:MAG: peptide chain release factor N(5)-glutamine methyltransferase [Alphaproteobacteria bacterium]
MTASTATSGSGTSVAVALAAATRRLAAAGIEHARLDARLLVARAAGVAVEDLIRDPARELTSREHRALQGLVGRRARREPLAHITGRREFWSLELAVSREVLTPRPESETLVDAVLERLPDRNSGVRILDLGTGSGCLLLALLSELVHATGVGVDRSEAALSVARWNARRLGLAGRAHFVVGDWGTALTGAFDVMMCNPPYVPSGLLSRLMPEVSANEPRLALDGGPDGLSAYGAVLADVRRLMAPDGLAALEVGQGQRRAVAALAEGAGLALAGVRDDLSGTERCLVVSCVK